MHSALIQMTRSYAACHLTTASQRRPSLVPLVLQARYTQTTTHLVDIIQTVSRNSHQRLCLFVEMDYTFILLFCSRMTTLGHSFISFDINGFETDFVKFLR